MARGVLRKPLRNVAHEHGICRLVASPEVDEARVWIRRKRGLPFTLCISNSLWISARAGLWPKRCPGTLWRHDAIGSLE